jgi:hypothetical protein
MFMKNSKQKFYVVCDANGICKGIFSNVETANKIADYCGAYVSEEIVRSLEPSRVKAWIKKKNDSGKCW